jgi:oligosaccharide reducing-end xylanase
VHRFPSGLRCFVLTVGLVAAGCGNSGEVSGAGGAPPTGGSTGVAGSGGSPATGRGGAAGRATAGSGGKATGGAGGTGNVVVSAGGTRGDCQAPSGYRNLFAELLGQSQSAIDAKVSAAVQQMFHGTADQVIYYELNADEAYIKDTGNNDVRSEGVSYGMTIAVEMNMKTEFDKLWKFAATRMRQSNGLFAWQLNTSGGIISKYAAPDGEEYFAMALMLASRRWGDNTGTNYGNEARAVMSAMVTQGDFNKNPAVVTFGPGNNFTDASYVLPLFYSEWACFDTTNAAFWKSATTYARTFFQAATNGTTGLAPDRSGFDGSPMGNYGSDAIRVPMNIMMDFNVNNADPWQGATYAPRMAAFWLKEGLSSYGESYTPSGTKQGSGHGAGAAGVNAMLAFALPTTDAKQFLTAVWNSAVPTGTYRYYEGCLYMLSMLHLSGKFDLFYQ